MSQTKERLFKIHFVFPVTMVNHFFIKKWLKIKSPAPTMRIATVNNGRNICFVVFLSFKFFTLSVFLNHYF